MLDKNVINKIKILVGPNLTYLFKGEHCTHISFTSNNNSFYGVLRHLPFNVKQNVLKLVCELQHLEHLDLSRNLLLTLPEELSNLKNLQTLNLLSNNLQKVPSFLSKFKRLKYLNLGSNNLNDIPSHLSELQTLEHLLLLKNIKIKNIDNIKELKNLKTLNLYFINLIKLPSFIHTFTQLNTLTIWNTSKYTHELDVLLNLEYFSNCGCPSLTELPPGFCRLSKLKMARLYQNSLKTISEDIGNLSNLEQLSLYQNKLSTLPESMYQLKKLTKLNLGWNKISKISEHILTLPNLKWLGLFQNPLINQLPQSEKVTIIYNRPFTTNY
jgi:Leucine-rich repeat (LRR) protein